MSQLQQELFLVVLAEHLKSDREMELIRDANVLAELTREFGLKAE